VPKPNWNARLISRRIPLATLLTIGMLAVDGESVFAGKGEVVIRSSATNVTIRYLAGNLYDACGGCETSPVSWAIAMPCDQFVCDQSIPPDGIPDATLTFSNNQTPQPVVYYVPTPSESDVIRIILLAEGVLSYPDNPNQQCVTVFKQNCSVNNPCPYIPPDVSATLTFAVCEEVICDVCDVVICESNVAGQFLCPFRIDPNLFINSTGLGGLITLDVDLANDPPLDPNLLDFGVTFKLPPPTSVPSSSSLGLMALALVLSSGIAVKFRRRGASVEVNAG
jgi:hypothetical protein